MSNNNVVKLEENRNVISNDPAPMSPSAMMLDMNTLNAISHVADLMANGKVSIPVHLRGNKGDCFAIAMQSAQWGMNPFAVAQKTHLSQSGALGYESQLVNAVVCNLAPITARPEYEFLGDWSKILGKVEERKSEKSGGKYYVATYTKKDEEGLGVIVRATLRGEAQPREVTVMMSQAYPRFSTQWATDPQQQITYLAIRKWARRYTPDVLLGVYTREELDAAGHEPRDMGRAEEVGQPAANSRTEAMRSKLASKRAAPAPTANLAKILRDIEAATNGHELKKAIEPAVHLASEADKEKVREAYQAKLNAERERAQREAAAENAAADEKQPAETHGEPPSITLAELQERFAKTTDVDVLDADATLIQQLTDEDEQSTACEAYNSRREELLGA